MKDMINPFKEEWKPFKEERKIDNMYWFLVGFFIGGIIGIIILDLIQKGIL